MTYLAKTPVTPGAYTNTNVTVDEYGRVTQAANGAASNPLATVPLGLYIGSPVGGTTAFRGAYCPSNDCTYLPYSGEIKVVDASIPNVVATITLANVRDCAYIPWLDQILALKNNNTFALINPATNAVASTQTLTPDPDFRSPTKTNTLAIDEVNSRIYMLGSLGLFRVNPADGVISHSDLVGYASAADLFYHPTKGTLYVAYDNVVEEVNATTFANIATITTTGVGSASSKSRFAYNAIDDILYVTRDSGANTLYSINCVTNAVSSIAIPAACGWPVYNNNLARVAVATSGRIYCYDSGGVLVQIITSAEIQTPLGFDYDPVELRYLSQHATTNGAIAVLQQ